MSDDDRPSAFEADYIARQLAARAPLVEGWRWGVSRRWRTFRMPPLPFYEDMTLLPASAGYCRVCAQAVYPKGAHFGDEPSRRNTWHRVCGQAFTFWTEPNCDVLGERQGWACAGCGTAAIGRAGGARRAFGVAAQADHIVPLYRVWRDLKGLYWTELLRYWSPDNIQVLCVACHKAKCAAEAAERARFDGTDRQLVLI